MAALLVVEDETALLRSLTQGLEEEGYSVFAADSANQCCQIAASEPVDAVLLDLMLPDGDGLRVLADLRRNGFSKPIVVVTARDAVEDRILGLDAGADDYLVKPFSFDELLARLRALLRRTRLPIWTTLRTGDLEMDLLTRRISRAGVEVELTRRQFELLEYLLRHANETVTREMIARDVWKETTATWTNVIEVQINQLRKRIERPELEPILHTIRGEGYCLGVHS